MPVALSRGVHALPHLPDRPWMNKLLRVVSVTPFGREKGSRKDRRKPPEQGGAGLRASQPGWQQGGPRSRPGEWTRSPAGRGAAQHPSPALPRLPPPPARAAGWERRRTGTREVCGNFSIPGTTRAPGRSSWSQEFESRGAARSQPSLAVVRPVLKGLRRECGPEAGRGAALVAGTETSQERPRGLPPAVPTRARRPPPSAPRPRLPGRRSAGGGSHRERGRRWQVAGPGSDARVPGKFTERDS